MLLTKKKEMILKTGKIFLAILLVNFTNIAVAKVTTSTESCNSGSPQVECRIIKTETNYKNDGSADWLKSGDAYQFRTLNGERCNIKGDLTSSSNSKLIYSSTYANKSGDWSKPGLNVEQVKEGSWNYKISWDLNCKAKKTSAEAEESKHASRDSELANTSPVGVWIVYVEGSKTKLTLNDDGKGSYYSYKNASRYIARWSSNGETINMRVYGTDVHYSNDEPAIILELTMRGTSVSGIQRSALPGYRDFTVQGKKR